MYLVWFEEELKNNLIIDVRHVACEVGGEPMAATCFVLRKLDEIGKIDESDIGIGFFNIYGRHYRDDKEWIDWTDSIADLNQFYRLLSSETGKKILDDYNITYNEILDLFPLDDEQKLLAKENINHMDEYLNVRKDFLKWYDNHKSVEIY